MSSIPWLPEDEIVFPDIDQALTDPDGLLAAGGDLTEERLVAAYRAGIFPWYDDEQPILWWSPDPRCVIDPRTFKPSRSLERRLRKKDYVLSIDTAFTDVIENCRNRGTAESTWITGDMKVAYQKLYESGLAHCVECYIDEVLVGGLYGIAIGPLFFGESMFHHVTDASKIAFHGLMQVMAEHNCPLVDCQMSNPHLLSLGATEIPRAAFRKLLEAHIDEPGPDWRSLQGSVDLRSP